ncbi:MAG: lipopolysaccharide assembly protein LapA domain-containing protein [Desulfuromonas sp.]|nr:lipopolysaccharide assembly protein LapA domain-containing protein [Desulfuromonas sp.]
MMKIVKIFAALVGLTLVFIFCSSNDTKVSLNFLEYSTPETYLFLYVLAAFVLGMISVSFGSTIKIMRLKRQINKLQPDDAVAAEKEKNKKDKKSQPQPQPEVAQPVASPVQVEETPIVTPPASIPEPDENVSDAVFADDTAAVAEEAKEQVIELPHDDAADVTSSEKK